MPECDKALARASYIPPQIVSCIRALAVARSQSFFRVIMLFSLYIGAFLRADIEIITYPQIKRR